MDERSKIKMEEPEPYGPPRDEIVLIGPLTVGKTTLALHLSERLKVLNYPMDRIKWYYRFRNGYDIAKGSKILREMGFRELLNYSYQYFSVQHIRVFMDEFRGGVIDFGGSQSYYPVNSDLMEARKILAPFRNVVLILPSPEVSECIRVLDQRVRRRYSPDERSDRTVESYIAMNLEFITHESNHILSKFVVYTEGKSVRDTADEILGLTGWANEADYSGLSEPRNQIEWRNLPNFG